MKRAGRCAEKHTPSSAPAGRQTSRRDPARQQAPVWFWAAYLRPTPTASLPCSSRNSSVSALTAALGCSPTSCAPAWSTPSATRCRAWWKSTRRLPFRTKDDPPTGGQGRSRPRCSSSAPCGEETSWAGRNRGHLALRRNAADPRHRKPRCIATMPCRQDRRSRPGSTKSSPTSKGARRYHGLRRKHLGLSR